MRLVACAEDLILLQRHTGTKLGCPNPKRVRLPDRLDYRCHRWCHDRRRSVGVGCVWATAMAHHLDLWFSGDHCGMFPCHHDRSPRHGVWRADRLVGYRSRHGCRQAARLDRHTRSSLRGFHLGAVPRALARGKDASTSPARTRRVCLCCPWACFGWVCGPRIRWVGAGRHHVCERSPRRSVWPASTARRGDGSCSSNLCWRRC